MMPLLMVNAGEEAVVSRVGGRPEVKQHLSDLGFVEGTKVAVVQAQGGDMIVKVRDSKLALTKEMAGKIQVV